MAKFIAYVETNKVGSRCEDEFEVPDEDLEGLTEDQREDYLTDWAKDIVFDGMMFEWGFCASEE